MIIPFLESLDMDAMKLPSRWRGHTKPAYNKPAYEPSTMNTKNSIKAKTKRRMARASRRRNRK